MIQAFDMIYPKHTTTYLLCVVTIPQDFTDDNDNNNKTYTSSAKSQPMASHLIKLCHMITEKKINKTNHGAKVYVKLWLTKLSGTANFLVCDFSLAVAGFSLEAAKCESIPIFKIQHWGAGK